MDTLRLLLGGICPVRHQVHIARSLPDECLVLPRCQQNSLCVFLPIIAVRELRILRSSGVSILSEHTQIVQDDNESSFSATTRSYTASVASRILTNNSDDSRAVWLNDGTAILAPASAPINGYKASALGIRSVCQSITTQCASCNGTQANVGIRCDGSQSGPTLLCRGPIKFAYNSSEEAFAGPLSRANGTKIFRDFGDKCVQYIKFT